jgi:hypothetical protein
LWEKSAAGLQGAFHWVVKSLGAERLLPARLRAQLDEKEKLRYVTELLFMSKMRPGDAKGGRTAAASTRRRKGANLRSATMSMGSPVPAVPKIVVEKPAAG